MKKNFFYLLFLILIIGCDRDPDKNLDPNILPDATQIGARTAGCIVNGKVWVASKKWLDGNKEFITWCEKNSNDWYSIKIGLRQIDNPKSKLNISFFIKNLELNKEYIFPIDTTNPPFTDTSKCIFTFDGNSLPYETKFPENLAKIKISRLDIQNQIVSGTFEFEAEDENGQKINIKDGRFDKKFD